MVEMFLSKLLIYALVAPKSSSMHRHWKPAFRAVISFSAQCLQGLGIEQAHKIVEIMLCVTRFYEHSRFSSAYVCKINGYLVVKDVSQLFHIEAVEM